MTAAVSSDMDKNALMLERYWEEQSGVLLPGDILIGATDALAEWCLRENDPDSFIQWVQELVETGTEALRNCHFSLAEESFNQILEEEPDNCCAAYNLSVIWLERDGLGGQLRAKACVEEIHSRFPDYLFASIALAQFAAIEGDMERASDLLEPVLDAKKLHVTEAIALFTAQVQIAIKHREFESAEQALGLLTQLTGENDPKVAILRRLIDNADRRGIFHRLRSLGLAAVGKSVGGG